MDASAEIEAEDIIKCAVNWPRQASPAALLSNGDLDLVIVKVVAYGIANTTEDIMAQVLFVHSM